MVRSYGFTGSSIEIQGGPLARAGHANTALMAAARATVRRRVNMATSGILVAGEMPVGCSGFVCVSLPSPTVPYRPLPSLYLIHSPIGGQDVELPRRIFP